VALKEEMMRVVLVGVLVASVGCKRSRESECDDLAKLGTAFASELGKQLGSGGSKDLGADPEIKSAMASFKQECMKWPQEVFDCMRANDETSPKCREAMSKVTGLVSTEVSKAPEGPAIVAGADLGETDWEGIATSLAPDGTLTAASSDWVVAVGADGHEKWRATMKTKRWLVPLKDQGAILVADREQHDVAALDAATGEVKWRASLPSPGEYENPSAEGAVLMGNAVVIVLDDGKFARIDPAACAKKGAACTAKVAFALEDETFDDPQLLAAGELIVVGESSAVRAFAQDGTLRASLRVRDTFGAVALLGGSRVAVTMDDELVLWDLAQCGKAPVVLPRKGGRMYMRGEGDCDDCAAPPPGCLIARSPLSDVESQPPFVLADGSIGVQVMDGPARVAPNGTKQWVTEVDAVGPMRQVGDALVFVSRDDDTKPPRAVALDLATGKARWQRALPKVSTDISYSSEPIVETAGPWLVVGAKGHVDWLKVGK
jgi:outer membrane protein assembly factor BamB